MRKIKLYGMFIFGWLCGAYWMFKKCYPNLKEYFSNINTTVNEED